MTVCFRFHLVSLCVYEQKIKRNIMFCVLRVGQARGMATNGKSSQAAIARVSLPDRHHKSPPRAAWQKLTTPSHGLTQALTANTLSVSYICPYFFFFAFTTPNDLAPLSLDLDYPPVSDLTLEFSLFLSHRLPNLDHVDERDLFHAQSTPGGTTSHPKRQRRISRSVRQVVLSSALLHLHVFPTLN
jgi:hypothetical protein